MDNYPPNGDPQNVQFHEQKVPVDEAIDTVCDKFREDTTLTERMNIFSRRTEDCQKRFNFSGPNPAHSGPNPA